MIFSLKWLKDYVEFELTPEELANRLTMAGLEVEDLHYKGKGLEGVIVALILDVRPHPNAERLSLCDVTDGENSYKVVCGADNMKPGDKVALATEGTELSPAAKFPNGLKIKKAKIRGELSEGMLCAEDELGLGGESDGIMILPKFAEVGNKLIDELGLSDVMVEVGITPNRSDCLSVIGVAREVAANLGTQVKYPDISVVEDGECIGNLINVQVFDSTKCPRYSCRVIRDLKIEQSPKWLKMKLESSGIRPINNVVDVTNFVLLELGQPLHAFDYDLLEEGRIVVRNAKEGEVIKTLDKVNRRLASNDLIICDGRKPLAVAGVMGGTSAEVSDKTTNVLLESAYFEPTTVRKTSKTISLRSESSYRFERGVDPNGAVNALDRAAELIRKLSGGEVAKGVIDEYPKRIEPVEVKLSLQRASYMLGVEIKPRDLSRIALGLGFEIINSSGEDFALSIPTFRGDVTREIDLIEEVARIRGYEKIPTTLPSILMESDLASTEKTVRRKLRELLISSGFYEVINYSFEDISFLSLFGERESLSIINPLTTDASTMRTSLLSGLIKNTVLNLNRQTSDIRLFEIGRVYVPKQEGSLPDEITKIAAVATGGKLPEIWSEEGFDFFDLKSVVEKVFTSLLLEDVKFLSCPDVEFLHPGKSARIMIKTNEVGFIGELHPSLRHKLEVSKKILAFEIDMDGVAAHSKKIQKKFTPLPKYPSVRRDMALIVDEKIPASDVLDEIKDMNIGLIEDASVFDVFSGDSLGKGKKSVAVSLRLRNANRTLTEQEVNKLQGKTLKKLALAIGAELRRM